MNKEQQTYTNSDKKGLIPELRFPEFKNDGDWKSQSIQRLIDNNYILSHLDGNHGALYPKSDEFTEKGVPYVTANDFVNGFVDFSNSKRLPIERAKKFKKGVSINGDILFAHNATVGPVAKLETNLKFVILSTTATYFRCDNIELINNFLKYSLSSFYFVKQYTSVMSQSTRNQVPITTQRKFFLFLPNPKEQQKIANCLSSLDNVINAETEKLDLLQDHKKGLLQQLFPQQDNVTLSGVEGQPKYRFPEFVDDGDWTMKYLKDLAEIKGRIGYRGYTKNDIVKKGSGAITLSPSNFGNNGKLNFEKATFISWEKYEESPEIKLEKGQTVLVKTASVGKSAYVDELPEKATVNPQIVVLKPKEIESKFLAFSIFHDYVQNQIKNCVGAGAIPNMSQASIAKIEILLPKRPEEQQKIANCLSSVDELIASQQQKIEGLKAHKKGLLQQLFPKILN